jgi:hypothetical protein
MSAKPLTANQCNHINARGRRCRMLSASDEESFCSHHLTQSAVSHPDGEALVAELLNSTGDLASAGDVNAFLGNVVKLRARRLIDRKDAIAFGYLSQLLLCTLSGMAKKLEAESDAIELEEVNKDIARMRASFEARLAPAKAAGPSQKSRNNPSTETKDSVGAVPEPAPSSAPTPAEPATPKPRRDYFSICT